MWGLGNFCIQCCVRVLCGICVKTVKRSSNSLHNRTTNNNTNNTNNKYGRRCGVERMASEAVRTIEDMEEEAFFCRWR